MSIKRPSKSTGTGVRKPVASTGVRHVEVMATRQMVSGELYSGWTCKNKSCGRVIAVVPPTAASKSTSAQYDDQVVIKCPHCGDENLYRWSARGEHPYTAPNA